MKNISILFVNGSYTPMTCGVGDYTALLAGALSKSADVSVLTSSYAGLPRASRPVMVMPEVPGWSMKYAPLILEKIIAAAPRIVHFQYPSSEYKRNLSFNLLPGMVKKTMPGVLIAETFHEPIAELGIAGKIRMLPNMSAADGCIFVEKEAFDRLPFYISGMLKWKEIAFIPVGSNMPVSKSGPGFKEKIRRNFGISRDKKIIVTFGFINPIKGFELLVRTLDPKKHAWIHIGKIYGDTPYQYEFLRKVAAAGLKINFTGYVSPADAASYLASADACVFPFIHGVTQRHATFLAAASQGVYTIASHGERRGYYKKENVYYIPLNSVTALKEALDFNTHKTRVKSSVFTWGEIAQQHMDFYKKMENK